MRSPGWRKSLVSGTRLEQHASHQHAGDAGGGPRFPEDYPNRLPMSGVQWRWRRQSRRRMRMGRREGKEQTNDAKMSLQSQQRRLGTLPKTTTMAKNPTSITRLTNAPEVYNRTFYLNLNLNQCLYHWVVCPRIDEHCECETKTKTKQNIFSKIQSVLGRHSTYPVGGELVPKVNVRSER
jgi:hypothetical protein